MVQRERDRRKDPKQKTQDIAKTKDLIRQRKLENPTRFKFKMRSYLQNTANKSKKQNVNSK